MCRRADVTSPRGWFYGLGGLQELSTGGLEIAHEKSWLSWAQLYD